MGLIGEKGAYVAYGTGSAKECYIVVWMGKFCELCRGIEALYRLNGVKKLWRYTIIIHKQRKWSD